ncbi:peptidoglycan-binding protein [Mucilaginibacter sp. L3T2-6]|uniref:peptidoglycan-binding protein n=1 Tax=Mucilaginibacter sp. L3T2-6 TaxID=3062491 RepID=UPI0026753B70|nr:peptidoglycan-binding protein [Mucilaginibacter sp. L3T2-6]MDO3640883.1 peptidoglycan-binding protein [Mucilaginibacter sp. L3T2-6]MDV6213641.1 peptidoglycan-binding protein [Mucilaginibacter sp. L3T2-6]
MNYPGHTIQQDTVDEASVKAIQHQLNKKGCGPVKISGDYNTDTFNAVMLFQTRFNDVYGRPLDADGIVGPITWAVLFGAKSNKAIINAPNKLLRTVLEIAAAEIGVTDTKSGTNPIDKYLDASAAAKGKPWSMAFVYWCFEEACTKLKVANPVFKTGDVLSGWRKSRGKILTCHDAKVNTSLVLPGQVFIIATGGGQGHAGFVERNENGLLTTIEGNICIDSADGSIGVFRRTGRFIDSINTGFIQFE